MPKLRNSTIWGIAIVVGSFLCAACDNAVRENTKATYAVVGDKQSILYPVEVRTDSEDVRIQMKESAPTPEIFSLDASGHAEPYLFKAEGNALTVPGKFDHLQLRHPGSQAIDIFNGNNRK